MPIKQLSSREQEELTKILAMKPAYRSAYQRKQVVKMIANRTPQEQAMVDKECKRIFDQIDIDIAKDKARIISKYNAKPPYKGFQAWWYWIPFINHKSVLTWDEKQNKTPSEISEDEFFKRTDIRRQQNYKEYQDGVDKQLAILSLQGTTEDISWNEYIIKHVPIALNMNGVYLYIMDKQTNEIINPIHIDNVDLEIAISKIDNARRKYNKFKTLDQLINPFQAFGSIRVRADLLDALGFLLISMVIFSAWVHITIGSFSVWQDFRYGYDLANFKDYSMMMMENTQWFNLYDLNLFEYGRLLGASFMYTFVACLFFWCPIALYTWIKSAYNPNYVNEDYIDIQIRVQSPLADDSLELSELDFPFQQMNLNLIDESIWITKMKTFRDIVNKHSTPTTIHRSIRHENFTPIKNSHNIMCIPFSDSLRL